MRPAERRHFDIVQADLGHAKAAAEERPNRPAQRKIEPDIAHDRQGGGVAVEIHGDRSELRLVQPVLTVGELSLRPQPFGESIADDQAAGPAGVAFDIHGIADARRRAVRASGRFVEKADAAEGADIQTIGLGGSRGQDRAESDRREQGFFHDLRPFNK